MKFSQGGDNVATASITRRISAAISQLCNAFTAWVIQTADFCVYCFSHTNS
jgi:hypothetical protein